MCGIVGMIDLAGSPVLPHILNNMANAIAHRGPDGQGYFLENNVGFGHKRLSIIDISEAGKQPMSDFSKQVVLSYNGEIYNFKDLKDELIMLGHHFNSSTDTEVVLNSWKQWGPACIEKFNGMFAFSVFDKRDNSIYLVRDRYGIKPLYFAKLDNLVLFGSEQKAIMQHPSLKKDIDKEALLEYFTFQNIFTNKTLLKDIKLLPAASCTRIRLDSKEIKTDIYWDYNFQEPKEKIDPREYEEELDRLLKNAVNRQLVSDVELGSYLSGGMDSGTLTALASAKLPYIKTFTCGFDLSSASGIELSYDERVKAEAMSALFKTEHYEMVLKSGDMERCLPALAHHLEEPRVGQSYPNYYAAQLASKFVKVVLSGTGGDELFGGYPWRYYRATKCNNFEDYIDQYYLFWQRLIDNKDIKNVFKPIWSDVEHVWTRDIFKEVFSGHENNLDRPEDFINHSLYFECKTFLQGLLLVEDKLSMAHGLETRVPFLDNDLVNFAMNCPVNLKLNNLNEVLRLNENDFGNKTNKYFQKTKDGKQILRNVMDKYIPTEITSSEKQGFSSPDASWFKGESIDFVKERLMEGDPIIYNFMDRKSIHKLVNEHLDGKENKRLLIWSLLNTEAYLQGLGMQ